MVLSMVAIPASLAGAAAGQPGNADVDFNRQTIDTDGGSSTGTVTVADVQDPANPGNTTLAIWNTTAAGDRDEVVGFVENPGTGAAVATVNTDLLDDTDQQLIAALHNGTGANVDLEPYVESDDVRVTLPDEQVRAGGIFYQGQMLALDLGDVQAVNQNSLALRRGLPEDASEGDGGTFVRELSVDDNGQVRIPTETLDSARYFITDDGGASAIDTTGGDDVRFEIAVQTFSAEFDEDSVSNTGDDTERALEIESNRDDYDIEVSDESGTLDAEDLNETFDGVDEVDEDDGNVTFTGLGTDEVIDANFSDVDAGTYNLTVDVVDSTAQDEASVDVAEIEGQREFNQTFYVNTIGDRTTVEIDLEETDEVYLFVGASDVNYVQRVQLVDENGNGSVAVTINTAFAGVDPQDPSDEAFEARDDTDVVVDPLDPADLEDMEVNTTLGGDRPGALDSATYPLIASESGDFTVENNDLVVDDEQDVADLEVRDADFDNITIHTAPRDDADAQDLDELLQDASKGGDDPTEIALRDRMIIEVSISGIFGFFDEGDDEEELGAAPLTLAARQSNPTANRDPVVFNFTKVQDDTEGANVILRQNFNASDDDLGRIFVVVDLDKIDGDAPGFTVPELSDGQEYNVTYGDTFFNRDTKNATLVDREATLDASAEDLVRVTANESQNITGTTTVAPNSELTIRSRSDDDTSPPFTKTTDVVVDDNGTFSAEQDFSEQAAGDEFEVSVRRGALAEREDADGEVVEPGALLVSNLDPQDVTVEPGATISVSATVENTGGVAVNETVEFRVGGNAVASREVELEPGESADVVFRGIDTSGLDAGEYEHGVFTGDDSQTATLTIQPEETPTPTPDETTPTPEDDTPGFGAVVALIALIAAALLATRRRQ